MDNENGYHIL